MGTIEEVIDEIQEDEKDNKGLVIGGVAVIILIVLLTKNNVGNSSDSEEYQLATSYSSYPDAVTNANTIIDSLQGSIDASDLDMKEFMSDNFTVAKDYKTEDLDKVIENNNKLQDTTIQSTDTIRNDISSVSTKVDNVQNYLTTTVTPKVDTVQKTVSTVNNTVNTVKNTVTNTAKSVKKVESNTNKIKKAVAPAKPKTTAKTTPKTATKKNNNTIKKTKYKGDSIVDGLKSVGVNSSYDNRKKIAQANGIKNYTGTAKQNTELLNKLKKGTLKKAK